MALCCERLIVNGVKDSTNEDDDGSLFQYKNGKTIHWSPGDLVQPLGSIETLMGVGGVFGTLNTVQAIWLKSKKQIKEEQVRSALWTLSRQIPHLQFCLSRQGYRLWFRRMKKFSLDFETSTEDVMKVYGELVHGKYNLWTGPLWKVRMIIPNANCQSSDDDASYSAVLIFSVQHSITDGTTNMKICRELLEILNQMCRTGATVTPKQIALAPIIDENIRGIPHFSFLAKYFCKKFLATMIKNFHHKSSFGSLPVPQTTTADTRVLYDELTEVETEVLIKMCKMAKITVHSCVVAVINFALLKVAQSQTTTPLGNCAINVTHCVNMRRHFSDEHKDTSGCHISFIEDKCKMSLHESVDFWNQAKKIHFNIKEHLEVGNQQLKIVPLLQLASMIFPANVFLTRRGYKNKTDCHYITTNMGNLKTMLPGPKEEDEMEITSVLRSVSSHLAGNPFLVAFHTFRNKFMISIDYYTNKMTEEVGQELFSTICKYIRNITMYGGLHEPQKC